MERVCHLRASWGVPAGALAACPETYPFPQNLGFWMEFGKCHPIPRTSLLRHHVCSSLCRKNLPWSQPGFNASRCGHCCDWGFCPHTGLTSRAVTSGSPPASEPAFLRQLCPVQQQFCPRLREERAGSGSVGMASGDSEGRPC